MTTQKLICRECKHEVLKVIEDSLENDQKEITRLAISSSSQDNILYLARQLILIGIKAAKYRIGDMYVKKT